MESMKSLKWTILFLLIIFILSFAGCSKETSNLETAQNFVNKVFHLPDEKFAQLLELNPEDQERYQKDLAAAIKSFCGNDVSDNMLSLESSFFKQIITLHLIAAGNNYTYTVDKVEVEETNSKQYIYTATITASNEDKPITLIGNVQFNDQKQIDYMDIKKQS